MTRGRRRLGRALIFIGVVLWIPELWMAWVVIDTLLTPIRASNGQLAHVTVHMNLTAWVTAVGWTLVSWGLAAWGLWLLRREPKA